LSTTLHESQSPVPALEIQMLKLYHNMRDEDRKQHLLDHAQRLIEEQRAERGTEPSCEYPSDGPNPVGL
jgi:hypothetical protein